MPTARLTQTGQRWTVPDGVTEVTVTWRLLGAWFNANSGLATFELGISVQSRTIRVSPGNYILVQIAATNGYMDLEWQGASRISGRLTVTGTGSSAVTVTEPPGVRIAGRLGIAGLGSSGATVAEPPGVRIAGRLQLAGTGSSAATVAEPPDVRVAGTLRIAGQGSSAADVMDLPGWRIHGRLRLEGVGASEATIDEPPAVRLRRRLRIRGLGASRVSVVQPDDVRIAGRLAVAGLGASRVAVVNPTPVRIAGRLRLSGFGMSRAVVREPQSWDVAIRASSPERAILTALEITHPEVAQPLRVVDATEGRTIEGNAYVALRFQARLAQDEESRAPRAEIAMDNVGREATRWIDEAGGGASAAVRVMQLPDNGEIEWEMTLDVLRVSIDSERLVARLGFDPGLGRPAVTVRHDPQTTPGIF